MPIEIIVCEPIRESNIYLGAVFDKDVNIFVKANSFSALETISLVIRLQPNVLIISSTPQDMDLKDMIAQIMHQAPTPIILLHSEYETDLVESIQDMKIGIIDYIKIQRTKQGMIVNEISLTTRVHILSKLTISKFNTKIKTTNKSNEQTKEKNKITDQTSMRQRRDGDSKSKARIEFFSGQNRSSKIIIIGTSTGGPKLLSELLPKFPTNLPPVVIVQHMPIGFIKAFATRLDKSVKVKVKEAESGENVVSGIVYFAPGGKHLVFHQIGNNVPQILLTDGDPVNFVKPAVDVTLKSAAKQYGRGVISLIMTGMGTDGREGSSHVKDQNGIVLALREEDSDIYGMNRSVIEAGLADKVLSKKDIVVGIIRAIEGKL